MRRNSKSFLAMLSVQNIRNVRLSEDLSAATASARRLAEEATRFHGAMLAIAELLADPRTCPVPLVTMSNPGWEGLADANGAFVEVFRQIDEINRRVLALLGEPDSELRTPTAETAKDAN